MSQRVNTVCIELVRGTLSNATMNVLLPGIIRDVYGIHNDEFYGVALNGMTRVFVKFAIVLQPVLQPVLWMNFKKDG